MVPSLEDPATPDHLAHHLSTWHAEADGSGSVTVTADNVEWWQDFHGWLPHPAGGPRLEHTHTGFSR
jgi:hypothetical protein